MRRRRLAGVLAGAAALMMPGVALAAPSFQVTDAGPAVSGLSTADQVAGTLLGPGVTLDGAATINGTATAGSYAAALPSFGRFSSGEADLGIPDGLVVAANARAGSFATGSYQSNIAADRDDNDLHGVVNAAGLCGGGGPSGCINNATSLEFAVRPTARYLKFEYALGITEVGFWSGSAWHGDVFSFPDGFALFVGGTQVADNCAVLPRTSTYVTMQTAGIVPSAVSGNNRATAQANLDARAADTATPPATPPSATPAPSSPVTPLAPRQVRTPRSSSAPVLLTQRLRFEQPGRYTFIYLDTATGKRIPQIRGSRLGARRLPGRYSAPVFRTATAGRKVVLASRFDRKRLPRSIDRVALRIVHRASDGTLTEVTMDRDGRLL